MGAGYTTEDSMTTKAARDLEPVHTTPRPLGTARSEPWLSLDDQTARDMLSALGQSAFRLALSSSAPVGRDAFDRMCNPVPGDLVFELFSRDHRALGYLLAVRREWLHDDAEWAQVGSQWDGDPRPSDIVYYVQYGPAPIDVCRWRNCEFYAILPDIR